MLWYTDIGQSLRNETGQALSEHLDPIVEVGEARPAAASAYAETDK